MNMKFLIKMADAIAHVDKLGLTRHQRLTLLIVKSIVSGIQTSTKPVVEAVANHDPNS